MGSKDALKEMPNGIAAAISVIIKYLEKTEKDFVDKNGHNKEENHENS